MRCELLACHVHLEELSGTLEDLLPEDQRLCEGRGKKEIRVREVIRVRQKDGTKKREKEVNKVCKVTE